MLYIVDWMYAVLCGVVVLRRVAISCASYSGCTPYAIQWPYTVHRGVALAGECRYAVEWSYTVCRAVAVRRTPWSGHTP